MIVVDVNILFPHVVKTPETPWVEKLVAHDPIWRFPPLWCVEFSSVLTKYVRAKRMDAARAEAALAQATDLYQRHEAPVNPELALKLALRTGISAYDAVYLGLSRELGIPLVTFDKALVANSGGGAMLIQDYLS